ncbi:MAG TPA: sterol desaturase family protein [Terriglobales bacterium]|nr:sterol desaturase family protein [Terriglobales bacterium]
MSTRDFISTIGLLFGLMGLLSLVELGIPLFHRDERSKGRGIANLGLTVVTFALNWGLISAAPVIALALSFRGTGLLRSVSWPSWAIVAVSVVTLDLCTYLAHVSMHKIPLLWRIHSVHHSDAFLDVSTTFRQHPLEGIWRFLWIIIPVWTLGIPVSAVVVYKLLSTGNALLEHANMRLWLPLDRFLSFAWVTPNMHKVHHSRAQAQTDSNYGNLLAVFDRGFHTFTQTEQAFGVVYGLDDSDSKRQKSFVSLLTLNLARRAQTDSARPHCQATK